MFPVPGRDNVKKKNEKPTKYSCILCSIHVCFVIPSLRDGQADCLSVHAPRKYFTIVSIKISIHKR